MGIRFFCPNGHKLNVKEFQAGRLGICPFCGARTQIPTQSTRPSAKANGRHGAGHATTQTLKDDLDSAEASDSSPDILPGEPPRLPGDPTSGKMLGPSTSLGNPIGGSAVIAPPAQPAAGQTSPDGSVPVVSSPAPAVGNVVRSAPMRSSSPAPVLTAAPAPVQPTPASPAPAAPCVDLPNSDSHSEGHSHRTGGARACRPTGCDGSRRPDCRSAGNDLVRATAFRRSVRPGLGRSDEELAQRRPRERRFADMA